mgnify:FL=1
MTSYFHLSRKSKNKKLNGIASSTSSWDTCSSSCGMFKECYAKHGPQSWHAKRVTSGERGTDWDSFCAAVESLKFGTMFRHNVSGDLPVSPQGLVLTEKLDQLQCAVVNAGLRFYTYTHHHTNQLGDVNANTVKRFSSPGFVINISTETVTDAVKYQRAGHDVVITNSAVFELAVRAIKDNKNPLEVVNTYDINSPVKVIPCPEQYTDSATCASCKLCARYNRGYVIAFRKH